MCYYKTTKRNCLYVFCLCYMKQPYTKDRGAHVFLLYTPRYQAPISHFDIKHPPAVQIRGINSTNLMNGAIAHQAPAVQISRKFNEFERCDCTSSTRRSNSLKFGEFERLCSSLDGTLSKIFARAYNHNFDKNHIPSMFGTILRISICS